MRIPSGPEAPKSSYPGRIYGRNPDLLVANIDEIILQTGMGPYMGDPELDHELHEACGGEHRGFFERQKLDLGGAEHSHQEAKFCWT